MDIQGRKIDRCASRIFETRLNIDDIAKGLHDLSDKDLMHIEKDLTDLSKLSEAIFEKFINKETK